MISKMNGKYVIAIVLAAFLPSCIGFDRRVSPKIVARSAPIGSLVQTLIPFKHNGGREWVAGSPQYYPPDDPDWDLPAGTILEIREVLHNASPWDTSFSTLVRIRSGKFVGKIAEIKYLFKYDSSRPAPGYFEPVMDTNHARRITGSMR